MSLRFFLPLVSYPDPTPRVGLENAVALAARLDGRIEALIHQVDIASIAPAFGEVLIDLSQMIAAAESLSRDNAQHLAASLSQMATAHNVPLSIERFTSSPELAADRFARTARTCDYALLVPTAPDGETDAHVEAVLFGAGGPAIVVPSGSFAPHLDTICLAWDGSRAAARALRDSLDILNHAGEVIILTDSTDKPVDPHGLRALRNFLKGHGIATHHRETDPSGRSVGTRLEVAALAAGAGLLVMGAYGHSRLQEFILGGATRAVLTHRRLPVLLSH